MSDIFYKSSNKGIIIQGVNIDELTDEFNKVDSFSASSIDHVKNYTKEIMQSYDKIENIFKSYNTWKTNNLKCWYCGLDFTNKPVFIPSRITNKEITTYGNFCSFCCCVKYININIKDNDKIKSQFINNLKYLYNEFYGVNISIFKEAPDKEKMNTYGGDLTIDQYKEFLTI